MTDWFRQVSWTKAEEDLFFEKLARARKENQAQYLSIQALTLVKTKDLKLLNVAESLIEKSFKNYPDNRLDRASLLIGLGNIYKMRNDPEMAIAYYRQALDFELVYPNVQTGAFIDYAELIVKLSKTELYEDAEKFLLKREPDLLFPFEKYMVYSLLSIINRYKKNTEQADDFLTLAEQAAVQETSGLRYHKHLGVVKDRYNWLDDRVRLQEPAHGKNLFKSLLQLFTSFYKKEN